MRSSRVTDEGVVDVVPTVSVECAIEEVCLLPVRSVDVSSETRTMMFICYAWESAEKSAYVRRLFAIPDE